MKNKLKIKILLCTILSTIILIICSKTSANTIKDIDIDVYIDNNGNAEITEVWNANLTQGTEGYRGFKNLEEKSISNFRVTDDTERTYTFINSWNTSASFDNKAYKCGINETSNGLELCWGISEYGDRAYTLKYNIQNLVVEYSDGVQGIYFNFLNLKQYIGNAKITIHSDKKLNLENSRIWSFGYKGTKDFDENGLVFKTTNSLSTSQYMVVLVRFEDKLFNVGYTNRENSFDDVYDSAMEGVDLKEHNVLIQNKEKMKKAMTISVIIMITIIAFVILKMTNKKFDKFTSDLYEKISKIIGYVFIIGFIIFAIYFIIVTKGRILAMLLPLIFNPISLILIGYLILKYTKGKDWILGSEEIGGKVYFEPFGKNIKEDVPNFRDIPCDKDLERAYWVCSNYNLVTPSVLKKGIIGAILLKWIKQGKVCISKTRGGIFNIKDNNYAIDLSDMTMTDNTIENSLLEMLVEVSGSNKILEAKEFKKWSKKYYYKLNSWFDSILTIEQEKLVEKGLIKTETKEVDGWFGSKRTITSYFVQEPLYEDAKNLKGLKNFLLEFSSINEKEAIEVHLWEEYLIFAHLLGIAEKVEKQFKKLYPELIENSEYDMDLTTEVIIGMADIGYREMMEEIRKKERRRYSSSSSHDYSGRSSSSGGSGSSYSSGGRSSGGSSGGGFR